MNLDELKLKQIGIDKTAFSRIFTYVDFGNVNYWYDKDIRDLEGALLTENQKLIVDIKKLSQFLDLFSEQKRFYYGWHKRIKSSWHIVIWAEKNGFIKVTKPIQFIKHYLDETELNITNRSIKEDALGKFIEIPKSNFDVEISVDAFRLLDKYDTFCLFSGDSDFAYLARFLKKRGKKVIVFASGKIFHTLKEASDYYVNAQQIKGYIASIKETSLSKG